MKPPIIPTSIASQALKRKQPPDIANNFTTKKVCSTHTFKEKNLNYTSDGNESTEYPIDLAEYIYSLGIGQTKSKTNESTPHTCKHRRDSRSGSIFPAVAAHPVGATAVERQPTPPAISSRVYKIPLSV